jgi:hypothetical protein
MLDEKRSSVDDYDLASRQLRNSLQCLQMGPNLARGNKRAGGLLAAGCWLLRC